MSIELPKSLERAMKTAGLVDPRTDNPSLNQWSKASGVHTTTISSFLAGRQSRQANVQKMADALDVPTADLYSMVGRKLSPWSPPSGTEKLNTRQRQALNELILSFIQDDPNAKAGEEHEPSSPSMNQAGVSPAPEAGPTADELEELRRRQDEADETPIDEILGLAADTGESEAERRARGEDSPE